jgi:hypothetical protein|nr:MAG TPA: tail assembly chaperone protein [Caudoviricetes sp.]
MDNSFSAFMADRTMNFEPVEVFVSQRFKSNGKPVPFKIRPITQEENEAVVKECTRNFMDPVTKVRQKKLDEFLYSAELIARCTVFPDLNDEALQDSYKAVGAADLARKMLLSGEFRRLADAILSVCGFDTAADLETAKN